MSGRAKFVFWWEDATDDHQPLPFFNVIENDLGKSNGSTVDGGSLQKEYGIPLPLFPSYETWVREVSEKQRCGRCWAALRGKADLEQHLRTNHLSAPAVLPHDHAAAMKEAIRRNGSFLAILLFVFTMSGCNGVRHILGVDRHDAEQIPDQPRAVAIIRQLPAQPQTVTFTPDYMNPADRLRVYVKNGFWLTATPGAWYEIDVKSDFDASISTEYAVVNLIAQEAYVVNQPAVSPRSIEVHSIPSGASDPGRPGQ